MSTELTEVTNAVAEFDRVSAGIAALRKKYSGIVYEVTTAPGMADAKAALPLDKIKSRAALYRLAFLMGRTPDEYPREAEACHHLPKLSQALPTGDGAALIARRPDIRAAEQRLRSSQANIAAARAAFFPRISLTTGFGLASSDLGGLFDTGARTWNFAPQVVMPIFDNGRNKASLSLAQIRSNIAITDYEKTIQIAFREVAAVFPDPLVDRVLV